MQILVSFRLFRTKKPIFFPSKVSLRVHLNSLRGKRLKGKVITGTPEARKARKGKGRKRL